MVNWPALVELVWRPINVIHRQSLSVGVVSRRQFVGRLIDCARAARRVLEVR